MKNLSMFGRQILKSIVITIVAGVMLYLLWALRISGESMPIVHTIGMDGGSFCPTIGKVREITISGTIEQPMELHLSVYDGKKLVLENDYQISEIKGNNTSIQQFEKGQELELEKKEYEVQAVIDGEISRTGHIRFIEYNGSYKSFYLGLSLICLAGVFALTLLLQSQKIKIEHKYFFVAIYCGLLFNFVMPPLGVPDEEAHFLEAYGLSNTLLGKEVKQDNYVLLDEADKDSIIYLHDISSISEWYDSFEIKKATGNIKEADMQSTVGSKAPWTYLPSAIGISIARLLNIHGNLLLLMGRLFNLLFEAGITALAIRILPYAKTYISVLGLVPEVIYLYGSYSYDGINLCLCILIVSYFLYLNAQEKKIKLHQLGILCLLLLLMIPIKLIYVFMALLVVLLPVRKLNLNRKQLMIGTIVGLAVILLIGINIIPVIKNAVGFNNNMTADEDLDAWNTLPYALQNIENTFHVFLRTIFGYTGEYLYNTFGEVVGKGRYNYLDTFTGFPGMRIGIVVLMIMALEDTGKNLLPRVKRCIAVGITGLIYLGVFVSLFFIFTAKRSTRIMGIQGRYFLPCFTLIPLIVKNRFFNLQISREKVCLYALVFCNILFAVLMFVHYATNYFT